jgi:phenylacetic acid degradation operon negative regulatory protein
MTEPALLAGFDAGQTHTTCRLAWCDGTGRLEVLAEGEGPGVCHLAAAGGEERFAAALRASLEQAHSAAAERWQDRLAALGPLQAAAVGASGIEQGTEVQRRGGILAAAALGLPDGRVLVSGDERTALQGAFAGRPGIVVISGTGCIALGRDHQGREHRCGGWGWQLDRAGSACDIGRDALALSLEMADGRRRETALRAEIWTALGDGKATLTPQRIKAMVVDPSFGPADFARLAPAVAALAEAGDPEAQAVLQQSARGLADLVAGVARALALESGEVCGLGGALRHLPRFAADHRRALKAALPLARLVPPRGDGCQGALQLAERMLSGESVQARLR